MHPAVEHINSWLQHPAMSVLLTAVMYTVSQKNDTDVAHGNFTAHQPISAIFGRYVAERACYQMMICYPTSPN